MWWTIHDHNESTLLCTIFSPFYYQNINITIFDRLNTFILKYIFRKKSIFIKFFLISFWLLFLPKLFRIVTKQLQFSIDRNTSFPLVEIKNAQNSLLTRRLELLKYFILSGITLLSSVVSCVLIHHSCIYYTI